VQTYGVTLGADVANHVANHVAKGGVVGLVKLLVSIQVLRTLVLTATILEVTLKLYLEEVLLVLPAKQPTKKDVLLRGKMLELVDLNRLKLLLWLSTDLVDQTRSMKNLLKL
jgi:hypothetical protein